MVFIEVGKIGFRPYRNTVRRHYERVFSYTYQTDVQSRSSQDVIYCESLDIFEAVCKKNIDSFHIFKYTKLTCTFYGLDHISSGYFYYFEPETVNYYQVLEPFITFSGFVTIVYNQCTTANSKQSCFAFQN